MGLLADFIQRWRDRKAKTADMEDTTRIQERIVEKRKSSNERELESYMEEDRPARIKQAVESYRKKKQHEFLYGNQILGDKRNIFKGQQSVTRSNKKREKKLFMQ